MSLSTTLYAKLLLQAEFINQLPIALANTLYELWTGFVHASMSKYAEYYNILSSQQEGFRPERNTLRQLQNMMLILSDARISKQDIYLMYIGFSSFIKQWAGQGPWRLKQAWLIADDASEAANSCRQCKVCALLISCCFHLETHIVCYDCQGCHAHCNMATPNNQQLFALIMF